jgi:hypothetical protein
MFPSWFSKNQTSSMLSNSSSGDLYIMTQYSTELRRGLITLGLVALSVLALLGLGILLHGGVCNYSTTDIWLTVSRSERQSVVPLGAGQCTNVLLLDADAIWGSDCSRGPCHYQAWKVGAGRFDVYDDGSSEVSPVLRIDGWGAGSQWRISEDWPKPNLAEVDYSLVK